MTPAGGPARHASFAHSLLPMLIADDQRRYVDVNGAACLLLRLSRDQVLKLRVDDLTPPEFRPAMRELWDGFLSGGVQGGRFELLMPDGHRLEVPYSATANYRPGLHISILDPLLSQLDRDAPEAHDAGALTDREREVLAVVAMGGTSQAIAQALHISVTTVDTHIRNSLAKLAARNRPHAIALALKRGELDLG